jgi:uncharacterized protein YjbI with pentapeptide repeats
MALRQRLAALDRCSADLRDADLRGAGLADAELGRVNTGRPSHGFTDLAEPTSGGAILRAVRHDDVIGRQAAVDDIA